MAEVDAWAGDFDPDEMPDIEPGDLVDVETTALATSALSLPPLAARTRPPPTQLAGFVFSGGP